MYSINEDTQPQVDTNNLKIKKMEEEKEELKWQENEKLSAEVSKRQPLIWRNIIGIFFLHIVALYSFVYIMQTKLLTIFFVPGMAFISGFGVTAGAHRLWCHRAYKAKLPLQIILLICYSSAGQNSIIDWVRDHRIHHMYSETDADPHNSNRGFWFSHVGWLMQRKHPEVLRKGRQLNLSDLYSDPLVVWHTKYLVYLRILFCFIIPTLIPVYLWNERWTFAILSQMFIRYAYTLNSTWAVNSFAHIYGNRPYNSKIGPAENIVVAITAMGEGWHNYHHVFPSDYKAAELGDYKFNYTTMLLDFFAKIGWAYDLKQPPPELVKRVIKNHKGVSHMQIKETDMITTNKCD